MKYSQKILLICFIIVVCVFTIYSQTAKFGFVNIDDDDYVYENSHVLGGFTLQNIKWAFTNTETALWIPVTWLSLMADSQLSGMNPGYFHIVNVLFHFFNALLLFFFLNMLTKGLWRSAIVAVLFAVHPLQVESVAWITERKDVLSLFFILLALNAYMMYVNKKQLFMYFSSLALFALGLMAKPSIVTFPLILFFLDFWPFKRFGFSRNTKIIAKTGKNISHPVNDSCRRILIEKLPFFALSAIISLITFIAAGNEKAMLGLRIMPLSQRVAQVFINYVSYLGKIFLPVNLAVFYPHETVMPHIWEIAAAAVFLIAVTVFAYKLRKKHPYLISGWIWYLAALLPVIGLLQAGSQSTADRFTYIPVIGIFMIVVWGVNEISKNYRFKKAFLPFTILLLMTLTIVSKTQAGYWRDSATLFNHALNVTSSNWLAHNGLGISYESRGDIAMAEEEYKKALSINSDYYYAHYNLARVYGLTGNYAGAEEHFAAVLSVRPDFADASYNLALALAKQGKYNDAVKFYRQTISNKPDFMEAHFNLAILYEDMKNYKEALKQFNEVLKLKPDFVEVYYHAGNIYAETGNPEKAIESYNDALRLKPDYPEALNNLSNVNEYLGKFEEAEKNYLKALSLKPGNAVLHRNFGGVLKKLGKIREAEEQFGIADSLEKK